MKSANQTNGTARNIGLGFFVAGLLTVATTSAIAEETTPATNEELRGMATLTCSGTLVRLNRSADKNAVVLTNGRCAKRHFIEPNAVVMNSAYDRGEIAVYLGEEKAQEVPVGQILYATMTDTDLALIELSATYAELEAKGAKVYEISETSPKVGDSFTAISGYAREKRTCQVTHSVSALTEGHWTLNHTLAFDEGCSVSGGWSGTPLVDPGTGKIAGMLNSVNMGGASCTLDNPCEKDANPPTAVSVSIAGRTYGQGVSALLNCLDDRGNLDLASKRCELPKPSTEKVADPVENKPESVEIKSGWPVSR